MLQEKRAEGKDMDRKPLNVRVESKPMVVLSISTSLSMQPDEKALSTAAREMNFHFRNIYK